MIGVEFLPLVGRMSGTSEYLATALLAYPFSSLSSFRFTALVLILAHELSSKINGMERNGTEWNGMI